MKLKHLEHIIVTNKKKQPKHLAAAAETQWTYYYNNNTRQLLQQQATNYCNMQIEETETTYQKIVLPQWLKLAATSRENYCSNGKIWARGLARSLPYWNNKWKRTATSGEHHYNTRESWNSRAHGTLATTTSLRSRGGGGGRRRRRGPRSDRGQEGGGGRPQI